MQWKDIRFARALVGQSPSFTIRKCKMRSQRGWGRQKASMDGMLAVTCCCCGGRSGWKWLEVIGSGMVKSRDGDVISDQTGDTRREKKERGNTRTSLSWADKAELSKPRKPRFLRPELCARSQGIGRGKLPQADGGRVTIGGFCCETVSLESLRLAGVSLQAAP